VCLPFCLSVLERGSSEVEDLRGEVEMYRSGIERLEREIREVAGGGGRGREGWGGRMWVGGTGATDDDDDDETTPPHNAIGIDDIEAMVRGMERDDDDDDDDDDDNNNNNNNNNNGGSQQQQQQQFIDPELFALEMENSNDKFMTVAEQLRKVIF